MVVRYVVGVFICDVRNCVLMCVISVCLNFCCLNVGVIVN